MNTLQTQPYFRNTGAGLLGGAMAGGQLAGMMNATNPMAYMLGGGLLGRVCVMNIMDILNQKIMNRYQTRKIIMGVVCKVY